MTNVTGVITRTLQDKIGWNRIGAAIGLIIVAVAAVALFHLLRDVEFDGVVAAIKAKSLTSMLIACAFVAAAYVTYTFYDFFALRTIGRTGASSSSAASCARMACSRRWRLTLGSIPSSSMRFWRAVR